MASSVNHTTGTLPRGRHGLGREEVRASQRRRLLQAMLDVVSAEGYAATSVTKVVAAARVSPNTFYEFFDDKADCFLTACGDGARELLELLYAAQGPSWTARVREGMRTYLRWWRDRPEVSRAYLVELPAVGLRAHAQRDEVYESYRAMFTALAQLARSEDPRLPPLSPIAVRALVAGLTEVVAEEVRADRIAGLPGLEDDFVRIVVKTLADDATAARA
jgi:AcrR family transcriptional regulator